MSMGELVQCHCTKGYDGIICYNLILAEERGDIKGRCDSLRIGTRAAEIILQSITNIIISQGAWRRF